METRDDIRMHNEHRKDATTRNLKNRAKKKLRETYGEPHPKSPEARRRAEKAAERAKSARYQDALDEADALEDSTKLGPLARARRADERWR